MTGVFVAAIYTNGKPKARLPIRRINAEEIRRALELGAKFRAAAEEALEPQRRIPEEYWRMRLG